MGEEDSLEEILLSSFGLLLSWRSLQIGTNYEQHNLSSNCVGPGLRIVLNRLKWNLGAP